MRSVPDTKTTNGVNRTNSSSRWIGVIWGALAIIIVAGGVWFFKVQVAGAEKTALETVSSIAHLKVRAIEDWRRERLSDTDVLAGAEFFIRGVDEWIKSPTKEGEKIILGRMMLMHTEYQDTDGLLIDPEGKELLSVLNTGSKLTKEDLAAIESAARDDRSVMTDLYLDPVSGKPRIDTVAPLIYKTLEGKKYIGSIVMIRNPELILYPIIETWPIPSETAETLLVRREGDYVIWLNDLRFMKGVALKKTEPLTEITLPAVRAVTGKGGIFRGIDYRNKKVVSFLAPIPDSPWFMVSKIDAGEIFEGIRFKVIGYFGFMGLIIIVALVSILATRQRALFFKKLHEQDGVVRDYALRLKESNEELEAFSFSVAHDLKTPLRAVGGFAKILSEDYASNLDNEARRVIGVIVDNVNKMGLLIDDLLRLSSVGRQAMELTDTDMTALARQVCEELKKTVPGDRVMEITVKPLPAAYADNTLVTQLLTNLILNAMKFTSGKDKAVIEVGGYDHLGERVYYVRDNGVGFDMKYADKLFGVFQRLHSQNEFPGTGIGLAIVGSAVRRHGGRAWAEGEVGRGATFYFTLSKP